MSLIRYIVVTIIVALTLVYFPTQSMGANIRCLTVICVGTNEDDYIDNTGNRNTGVRIEGRGGNDFIYGGHSLAGEYIEGGEGDDIIVGEVGPDTIIGNGGNDKVDGGWGDDIIAGSEGNDDLAGGLGDDDIIGDNLYGPGLRFSGSDSISGGMGNDGILTGTGENRDFHADSVNCGEGNDGVVLRSTDGDFAYSNCERVFDFDR